MACNGARICPISCLPCLPECAMLRTAHRYRFLDGEGVMTSEVAGYYCGASGRPESDTELYSEEDMREWQER